MSTDAANKPFRSDVLSLLILMSTIAVLAAFYRSWLTFPSEQVLVRQFNELQHSTQFYRVGPNQVREILNRQPAAATNESEIYRWRCWRGAYQLDM